MIVLQNGLTIETHCSKVRVEGRLSWFACTLAPKHEGRCEMIPVTPRTTFVEVEVQKEKP